MEISEINILRDGGTILFKISGWANSAACGLYRLQTPYAGEPRRLFKDDMPIELAGAEERQLLVALQRWIAEKTTPAMGKALHELDQLEAWRNLPDDLVAALPLHRIRYVADVLSSRCSAEVLGE